MRKLTIGLALGALFALGLTTSAYGASTEATWNATATGSPQGGNKATPAPFTGTWTLTATNNINPSYRPATPSSWTWSWEGVTVKQNGIPFCTPEQINDSKSIAGCPAGSHIGQGDIPGAAFGPTGLAEGPNTECNGKKFDLFNGPHGALTLSIDGPPELCGTLGFLGAYPIVLAQSGNSTTMTWNIPDNLQHPFPGAEGTLRGGSMPFNPLKPTTKKKKKGKKGKKQFLFTSTNCKGPRDFTMTVVDTFGTHTIHTTAGTCKPPKKKKKK
jgi:hypothetical protein